jgi:lipoprotein
MIKIKSISQVLMAVIITVITVGLISCDDRNFGNEEGNKSKTSPNFAPTYNHNNNFEVINNGERVLTDEQIEKIGQMHNEICMKIIDNLKVNDSVYDILYNHFKSFEIPDCDLVKIPEGMSFKEYTDAMVAYNIPAEVKGFIDDALNYVGKNYRYVKDISHYVAGRKDIAKKKFKGVNLDIALTGLTVLDYSARLWSDKSHGGLGYYVKLLNNSDTTHIVYDLSKDQLNRIEEVLKGDLDAAVMFLAVGIVVAAIEAASFGTLTLAAGAIQTIMIKLVGTAALHSAIEIATIVNEDSDEPAKISPIAIKWNRNFEYQGLIVGNPF